MYTTQNGLHVLFHRLEREPIERDLKAIDHRLFLDPEFSQPYNQTYWTVKFWNGERAPSPVTLIVDWRERNGKPKELSFAMVEEVKRLYQKGEVTFAQITKKNEEMLAKRGDKAQENYEYQAVQTRRNLRVKPVFHRGRALYLARIRARRKGEEV